MNHWEDDNPIGSLTDPMSPRKRPLPFGCPDADAHRYGLAKLLTGWWLGHPSEKYESHLG